MSRRLWLGALASLVAVRVAIPLVVLAAAGHDLPGLPPYDYSPLNGDATGFYAEARELISVAFGPAGAAALLLVAAGRGGVWRLGRTWVSIAVGCLAVSLAGVALVLGTEPAGAAVVGWPLLWSLPLLPFRVARRSRSRRRLRRRPARSRSPRTRSRSSRPRTPAAGERPPRRRRRAAAALFAVWPLLTRPLAGPSAWENGQWNVDVGLHLYTEPLSTALIAAALALLLAPSLDAAAARAGGRSARLRDRRAGPRTASSPPLRCAARRVPARPPAGAAAALLRARVRSARRRLLAEGLSRDPERARLLARPGGAELGRLAASSTRGPLLCCCRWRCSALLALRPWSAGAARRGDRHQRRSSTPSTSTRTCTRASSTRPLPALFVLEAAAAG